MHNAAFTALGLDARYEARDVAPADLERVVNSLRGEAILGANVTVPYKLAVMPFVDELTPAATAMGAVNTIITKGAKLTGHNTDAAGFTRALQEAGVTLKNKRVVMLGAGGAARAVAYALLQAGSSLYIYNRSPEKAVALAKDFAAYGTINILTVELAAGELAAAVRDCDVLVNTTSVGMEHGGLDPNTSPLPQGVLPARGFVSDIIYRPAKTKLLREAEAAGLRVQNGLPMLVYQGAESFECWTRQAPDTDVMLAAARALL